MEEEPVQAIRETKRNLLLLNRRRQKDEETDVRRSLGNLRVNESDITTIANKLKTKASISVSELKLLQNMLVDDVTSAQVVLKTHGALRGLIRELTGHDVNKQCAACGCICNLALGDSKTCLTVAKPAGAYLVASLSSMTTQLATSCAWSVGNLCGARGAGAVLAAQGALAKLADVTGAAPRDVSGAALYALTHAAFVMRDELSCEHLHKIMHSLSTTELNMDSCRLLFILSCHKDFTPELIQEAYLRRIVEHLSVSMKNHITICRGHIDQHDARIDQDSYKADQKSSEALDGTKCCELVYLLRVLANLNSGKVYSDLVSYFVSSHLVVNIKWMLERDADESLLWLLGNIFNCCGGGDFFDKLLMQA